MSESEKNSYHYGGQAVIEGVMMRGRHHFSVACRRENNELVTTTEPVAASILGRLKWLDKPFLRGTLAMIDTIALGMKALMFSANVAMEDAQAADAAAKGQEVDRKKQKSVNDITLSVTLILGLALGIALFMLVPTVITFRAKAVMPKWSWPVIEGLIKVTLFVGYVWAISWMKDIRRIFQYHGAEHSTINAYEAGEDLTVENAMKYTTVHVRCGTSFILVVLVTSILIFSFLPWHTWLQRFLLKLLLLPLVAGIAYEIIKFAGRRKESRLLRLLLSPGLLMQRITTQRPSTDQIEVAIKALQNVLEHEQAPVERASNLATNT